eukprot:1158661-Pelagomonas_calceolata.AAC.4
MALIISSAFGNCSASLTSLPETAAHYPQASDNVMHQFCSASLLGNDKCVHITSLSLVTVKIWLACSKYTKKVHNTQAVYSRLNFYVTCRYTKVEHQQGSFIELEVTSAHRIFDNTSFEEYGIENTEKQATPNPNSPKKTAKHAHEHKLLVAQSCSMS